MKDDGRDVVQAFIRVGDVCTEDEKFREATKYWTGSLWIGIGARFIVFRFEGGNLQSVSKTCGSLEEIESQFGLVASVDTWRRALLAASGTGAPDGESWVSEVSRVGDRDTYWRYHIALRRLIELVQVEMR